MVDVHVTHGASMSNPSAKHKSFVFGARDLSALADDQRRKRHGRLVAAVTISAPDPYPGAPPGAFRRALVGNHGHALLRE
jgi:hypothetical protein